MSPILQWSAVLGATGFVCGFFGPMLLNPWANQGPLAGLLITGPGGALLGAVLGAIVAAVRPRPGVARALLASAAAVGGLAILVTALPEPEHTALLLDAKLRACAPAISWRDRAFATWDRRLAINSWATPPPAWRETFERAAASGSVLTLDVSRHRDLGRGRRPWNRGVLEATPWTAGQARRMQRPEHVYMDGNCAHFGEGAAGVYVAHSVGPERDSYPPADPARFLDMLTLEAVPADYAPFAR